MRFVAEIVALHFNLSRSSISHSGSFDVANAHRVESGCEPGEFLVLWLPTCLFCSREMIARPTTSALLTSCLTGLTTDHVSGYPLLLRCIKYRVAKTPGGVSLDLRY